MGYCKEGHHFLLDLKAIYKRTIIIIFGCVGYRVVAGGKAHRALCTVLRARCSVRGALCVVPYAGCSVRGALCVVLCAR